MVSIAPTAKIPAVSWEIQENVKKNVESMTGLSVRKVNVHIVGIEVKEDAASDDENKENTEETTEEN